MVGDHAAVLQHEQELPHVVDVVQRVVPHDDQVHRLHKMASEVEDLTSLYESVSARSEEISAMAGTSSGPTRWGP